MNRLQAELITLSQKKDDNSVTHTSLNIYKTNMIVKRKTIRKWNIT